MSDLYDTSGSFKKGILLLVLLVAVIVLYPRIPAITSKLFNKVTEETEETTHAYSEEEQKELRKEFAGNWVYKGLLRDGGTVDDRFEVTKPGYIYRETAFSYPLPNGDSVTYKVLREDLLNPLSFVEETATHNVELFFLNRYHLWSSDTCKFDVKKGSEMSELTDISFDSSDNMVYDAYTYQKTEGSSNFFSNPAKPIDSLLWSRDYYICYENESNLIRKRNAIVASVEGLPYSAEKQSELVEKYYFPYTIQTMDLYSPMGVDQPFTLNITIAADGSVKSVAVVGKIAASRSSRAIIEDEVKSWKFLSHSAENSISFTGKM